MQPMRVLQEVIKPRALASLQHLHTMAEEGTGGSQGGHTPMEVDMQPARPQVGQVGMVGWKSGMSPCLCLCATWRSSSGW